MENHPLGRRLLAGMLLGLLAACGVSGSDGTASRALTPTAATCPDAPGPVAGPIVFGTDNNLAAVGTDGAPVQQLTRLDGTAYAAEPAWSPDGRTLAYTLARPTNDPDLPWLPIGIICGIDRASGAGRLLAHTTSPVDGLHEASWSPDGTALIVTLHQAQLDAQRQYLADRSSVARYDLATGELTPLVANALSGTLSPDGTRLAFLALDPQSLGVTLMIGAADATGAQAVPRRSPALVRLFSPRWSPDGRRLLFTASGGEPVSAVPAQRSWLEALLGVRVARAHGPPTDVWTAEPRALPERVTRLGLDDSRATWSPDGMQVAYTTGTGGIAVRELVSGVQRAVTEQGNFGGITWAP